MAKTTIQWCDYTFNPWIGCRKVAPECANCYAETLDRNRYSKTLDGGSKEHPVSHWGSGPRHRTKTWGDPLKWNKATHICDECGKATMQLGGIVAICAHCHCPHVHRPRVFCASLADWLDDENVPIEWFADLLKLIHATPNLDWLLLTKRPQNWYSRLSLVSGEMAESWIDCIDMPERGVVPENVWIGVSAGADQAAALDIPARIHFLSCEPMLKPIGASGALHTARFDWAIFGGESGSSARECHTDWIRDGVEFCRLNGIAPFVKQLGSNCLAAGRDQKFLIAMKDSHGGDMAEWPEDLRVREFPTPQNIR